MAVLRTLIHSGVFMGFFPISYSKMGGAWLTLKYIDLQDVDMKKIEYLTETYLPMVLEGEDFSKFKNSSEIYFYIKPYVEQLTADDEEVTSVADLTENIADEIFKLNKSKMKGHRTRAPAKKRSPAVRVDVRKMF